MYIKNVKFKNFLTFEKDKEVVLDFMKNDVDKASTLVLLGGNCSGKTSIANLISDFFEFLLAFPTDWYDKEDIDNIVNQSVGNLFTSEQLRYLIKIIFTTYTFFETTFVSTYDNYDVTNLHENLSSIMEISHKQCEDILINLCNLYNTRKVNRWLRKRRTGANNAMISMTFYDDRIGEFTCSIKDDLYNDEEVINTFGSKVDSYLRYVNKFEINIVGENGEELSQQKLEYIVEKLLLYKENIHVKLPNHNSKWTDNINLVVNDLYHWIGESNLLKAIRLFVPQVSSIEWNTSVQYKQNNLKFIEYLNLSNGLSKIMINDLPYAVKEFLVILSYLISFTRADEGLVIIDNLGCLLDVDKVMILSRIKKELNLGQKSQFIYTIRKLPIYDALYGDKKVYFLNFVGDKQVVKELDTKIYDSEKIQELLDKDKQEKINQNDNFATDVVKQVTMISTKPSNKLKS